MRIDRGLSGHQWFDKQIYCRRRFLHFIDNEAAKYEAVLMRWGFWLPDLFSAYS